MKILQDRQGFLWFGTKKGLIRYDGYQFVHYRYELNKPGGISGDFIRDLAEDDNGDLWIAIENGGLNKYIRSTNTFESFRFQEGDSAGLPTNDVLSVLLDTDGTIWLGTRKGLCKFDTSTKQFTRIRTITNAPEPVIMRLIKDHRKIIWLASYNIGLIAYDPLTGKARQYLPDPADQASICDNVLWTVYEDHRLNLWIGSWRKGLDRFDTLTGKFIHYRHNPADLTSISSDVISSIYEDREQRLWISTYGNGINLYDRSSGGFRHYIQDTDNESGIGPGYTLCVFQDHAGSIWVGTYGAGLHVSLMSWKKIYINRTIVADEKQTMLSAVNAIHRTGEGILLIGTEKQGLTVYDTAANILYPYPLKSTHKISRYTVFCIHESGNQLIWLGANLGLARIDAAKKTFDLFQNPWTDNQRLETLIEFPGNRLLANYIDYGPYIFNPETKRFSRLSDEAGDIGNLEGKRIICFHNDGDSVLWLGTNRGGLYKYHHHSKRLSQYTVIPNDSNSISNNVVLVIYPGTDGTLWIGTEGGLNHFDKRSGHFKVYREKDGLANDMVFGVMEGRHGMQWIITSTGVSCFNPAVNSVRNYDHTDGFPDGMFSAKSSLCLNDGTILAGHEQGLVRFHPDELQDNPFPPPVVITGFKKLNRTADLGQNIATTGELELSYKDYLIAFEFASLNFIHPEKNRHAYMIEGFDEQWNYTEKERTAVYTNLNPGTYTFRVRGSNNDGVWNETGASVRLIILPPLWKTWWAYSFYVIFAIVVLYSGYQWRIRSIKNRNKELALKVEERTRELKHTQAELIQSVKMASLGEMVAGLSHEINNPVTFVTGNIQFVRHDIKTFLETSGHKDLKSFLSDIDHMLESSFHGANRIRDIVRNMKHFSKLDESEYKEIKIHKEIDTILDLFFNQLKDIRFVRQYDPLLNEGLVNCYARQINQCLRNILINAVQAIREAEKNNLLPSGAGKIFIETKKSDQYIQLSFKDNGIGIPTDILDKVFDPFFTTRDVGSGKGLGLSEAYGIIQKHQGTITISSEYGKGTEVKIVIPYYTA